MKPCGYCKRPKTDHTEWCRYNPVKRTPPPGKRRASARAAVKREVAARGNGLKSTGQEFLSGLKLMRARLEVQIAAVEHLVAILSIDEAVSHRADPSAAAIADRHYG